MITYLIGVIDFIHNNVERNTLLAVALNGAWAGCDALIMDRGVKHISRSQRRREGKCAAEQVKKQLQLSLLVFF
jgi:hypothetical protein